MLKVTIYLKSGQSFTIHMDKFAIRKNLAGTFAEFEWTNISRFEPTLKYVDIDDISAIVSQEVGKDA